MACSVLASAFALVLVASELLAALADCDVEECEEVQDLQLLQTETFSVKLATSVVKSRSIEKPIVITGTALEVGGWGASLYRRLKSSGQPVRAIPAPFMDMKAALECQACDETEGIFIVDYAEQFSDAGQAAFRRALTGVKAVVSPAYMPHPLQTMIPNVVKITAQESPTATFLMISDMNTTAVDVPQGVGSDTLYWEAELLTSSLPYAILKTCIREEGPAGNKELVVAPADQAQLIGEFEGVQTGKFSGSHRISNADVSRVADFWANLPPPENPVGGLRSGARFDLCAKDGTPTADEALPDIIPKAWYPWQLVSYGEPTAEALAAAPILVTGATGRTGRLVYHALRSKNVPTRAFVRNRAKAREVLGCDACDESEGIYVGDVRNAESFMDSVWDVRGIIITTTGEVVHGETGVSFPEAREIDMWGTYLQVFAAGEAAEKSGRRPFVFYVGATDLERDSPNQLLFNKLNGEVLSMSQGLPFVIVKPCKLNDDAGGQTEVLVGPSDSLRDVDRSAGTMSRADLARLLVEMATPGEATSRVNLRFDVCSAPLSSAGATATDLEDPASLAGLLDQVTSYAEQ